MRCVASAIAALLLAACGGEDAAPPAPGPAPVPAPPPDVPPSPPGDVVPADLGGGDAARGAEVYGQLCWTCHGPEGRGDGPTAATLSPKPADHTDGAYMGSLSDEDLYLVIAKGGAAVGKSPLMTAWGGVLDDDAIRDLIAHIRRLSGT